MNQQASTAKKLETLVISIRDLQEGMAFDAPVYFEGDNLFVDANLPVRLRDIRKLERLGIETVATQGNIVPKQQEKNKNHQTIRLFYLQEREVRCLKFYTGLYDEARLIFASLKNKEPVGKKRIDDLIHALFRLVRENPKEMIRIIHGIDNSQDDPAMNALHTAIIAMVMGMQKKLLAHDLYALTTAGLLHDIGMLSIPEAILTKRGRLSPAELGTVQRHPALSHAMIRELGYPLEIADISLAHHERWDGTGYPKRVAGHTLSEHALILAVADAYAALINQKPYRKHLLGYDALKVIIRGLSHQYSPRIVKLLMQCIGVYPLGSLVLLNNFSIGRVIRTQENSPLRPHVEIIQDKYGDKVETPLTIDLVEKNNLYIIKALDPLDLVLA